MSNSRRLRRQLAATKQARERALKNAGARFPGRPASLSTIRRWLKQAESDGHVEHRVDTSKPGHPHEWTLTEAGHAHLDAKPRSVRNELTDLQARRAYNLMRKHGVSEQRAIAAVTKNWAKPQ